MNDIGSFQRPTYGQVLKRIAEEAIAAMEQPQRFLDQDLCKDEAGVPTSVWSDSGFARSADGWILKKAYDLYYLVPCGRREGGRKVTSFVILQTFNKACVAATGVSFVSMSTARGKKLPVAALRMIADRIPEYD